MAVSRPKKAVATVAAIYTADAATGNEDVKLQQFLNDMSSDALREGKPRKVHLPQGNLFQTQGLIIPDHIAIDGNGSTIKKIANANYSLPFFTNPTTSVMRCAISKVNGSFYGRNRFQGLENITLDANNKDYLSVLELFNVEHFKFGGGLTLIAGLWSCNWSFRGVGRHVSGRGVDILGASRVFQDGFHWIAGRDIHVSDIYVEHGDDAIPVGDDQITAAAGVYYDDQDLRDFSFTRVRCLGIRGYAQKTYANGVKPYSSIGYTRTGRVSGGRIEVTGKSGLLRNGGVSWVHTGSNSDPAQPDTRILSDIRDIKVDADLEVGTDGTAVYSAVPGAVVGSPTSVTVLAPDSNFGGLSPVQVVLPAHGLSTGNVVTFLEIPPDGMQNLGGFYQVVVSDPNTFQLSDIAFRSNWRLQGLGFAPWTSGKVVKCSPGVGTGYKVGEDLSLDGGTLSGEANATPAVFRTTDVGPNGELLAVRLISAGKYTVLPSTPNNPTGGSGSGAVLQLELTHSGVNAHGLQATGVMDCELTGRLLINDTPVGSSKRFDAGYLIDCQGVKFKASVPVIPANGGVWVLNESIAQKSRHNEVASHLTMSASVAAGAGAINLFNSQATVISGLVDEVGTNQSAVVFGFNGAFGKQTVIGGISTDDPARFSVSYPLGDFYLPSDARPPAHWKTGDLVLVTENVLSTGTLNGVYYVRQMLDTATLTLNTLDGDPLTLNGLTVTTPGKIALANATTFVKEFTTRRAGTVANGSFAFSAASSAPVVGEGLAGANLRRTIGLTVRDSDLSLVDVPFADSVIGSATLQGAPLLVLDNVKGQTLRVKNYRNTSITPDLTISERIVVTVPNAAVTINAPIRARKGQMLEVTIKQPAVTAQSITWNAVFKKAADPGLVANTTGVTRFTFDGSNWVQQGGPLIYL